MKNWNKLSNWFFTLIGFELVLMVLCFFFAREIIIEQIIFFMLSLFAVLVLSDLLLTWTILIAFGLGVTFLVAGVVYIPTYQRIILLFSFPLLLGILTRIRYYLFKEISKVQDQEEDAFAEYQSMLPTDESLSDEKIQALLIHWAHEELFFQIRPREYNRTLSKINDLIVQELNHYEKVYYVSNGNFLVLTDGNQRQLQEYYQEQLKSQLEELVFNGEDGIQSIQFQMGYLEINAENSKKYHRYENMINNLKRQLETDIIVEY